MTTDEKKEPAKPTILLVEDDSSQMQILKYVLESENFRIDTAKDGSEAIDLINKNTYDIVVTDLKMPGETDGMAVLQTTKETSPLTEVFVMTAYGTIESAVQAMLQGAYDFIQKPINISEFRIKLQRALSLKQSSKELDSSDMRKHNYDILLRQVKDQATRLKNIRSSAKLILQGIGPDSTHEKTMRKILKESDI